MQLIPFYLKKDYKTITSYISISIYPVPYNHAVSPKSLFSVPFHEILPRCPILPSFPMVNACVNPWLMPSKGLKSTPLNASVLPSKLRRRLL